MASNRKLERVQERIRKLEKRINSDFDALNKKFDNVNKLTERKLETVSKVKTIHNEAAVSYRVERKHLQDVFRDDYASEVCRTSNSNIPSDATLVSLFINHTIKSEILIIPPVEETKDYSSWTEERFKQEINHIKSYWRKKLFKFLQDKGGLKDITPKTRTEICDIIYKDFSLFARLCTKKLKPKWDSDGKYEIPKNSDESKILTPVKSLRAIGLNMLAYCLTFYLRGIFLSNWDYHDLVFKPFMQFTSSNVPKLLFHHLLDDICSKPIPNSLAMLPDQSIKKKHIDVDRFYQAFVTKKVVKGQIDYTPVTEDLYDDDEDDILGNKIPTNKRFPYNKYSYDHFVDVALLKTIDAPLKVTTNFHITFEFHKNDYTYPLSYYNYEEPRVIDSKKRYRINILDTLLSRTTHLVGSTITFAELRLYLSKPDKKSPRKKLVQSRSHLLSVEETCTSEEPAIYLSNYKSKVKSTLLKVLLDLGITSYVLKKYDVELRDAKFSTLQGERYYVSPRYKAHLERKKQRKLEMEKS